MTFARESQELSDDARGFLQARVAHAGLAGAAGVGGFLAFRVLDVFVAGQPRELLDSTMVLHAAAVLPLLGMWLLCRRGMRSAMFARWTEGVGLLGTTLGLVAMGMFIDLYGRPEMVVHSALTFGLTARAIYVPSSARRTLLLTATAGVPLLVGCYFTYLRINSAEWGQLAPDVAAAAPQDIALSVTINAAVWWLLTTGLCTAASRVIYGLRRDVKQARRLGQYTLEQKLGEGGMGMVYRARHALLRRPTAVKLLLPEKAGEANLARFEREVQLTAQLSHPNTVKIHDYGRTHDGTLYYVMELLNGADLERIVAADGPLPPARVLHVLEQIAAALREAHGIGLIHRDIKPSNIILCQQGGLADVAKLVDFGLVKQIGDSSEAALTSPEVVTGTPLYMPPEAIVDPKQVDARSDLYALGAVGYYLLTGTHVFGGNTLMEVCGHHLHTTPEPPSVRLGKPVPADLEALLLACLSKQKGQRPTDAEHLLERLRTCAEHGHWRERSAHDWWDKWGQELRPQSNKASPSSAHTELQVDFDARRPG